MSAIYCRHLKDLSCLYAAGIHVFKLGKACYQKHLPEHIKAVVAGRAVSSYCYRDSPLKILFYWGDSAGKLGIGAWVCHSEKTSVLHDLSVVLIGPYNVVSASAVVKKAKAVKELYRRHTISLYALHKLRLSLLNMSPKRCLVFLYQLCRLHKKLF